MIHTLVENVPGSPGTGTAGSAGAAPFSPYRQSAGRTDPLVGTVHGFRSTFRDWAGDCTHFPRDVCEAALAHGVENEVEAAYRRGDAFEKRRLLMQAWSDYCAGQANVVPLVRAA